MMIVVKLYGGLGNQMFQYAFARAIANRTGGKIYLDRYGFWNSPDNHGEFLGERMLLNAQCVRMIDSPVLSRAFRFALRAGNGSVRHLKGESERKRFLRKAKLGLYQTQSTVQIGESIKDILGRHRMVLVDGYFQWPQMFQDIRTHLADELCLTGEALNGLPQADRDLLQEIGDAESVCVHIRRGDYLNTPTLQVCNYGYYREAIDLVRAKHPSAKFFIFSDDAQWVRGHYEFSGNVKLVEGKRPAGVEWYIMSRSKHFILSNSTFSWWAQYLSPNPAKMVVAPSPWFNDGREVELYQEDFTVLRPTGGMDR